MMIVSPLYNGMSNSRWVRLSGNGIFSAFLELVSRIFGELQS
jgi:hypothetical protein